MFIIPFVLSLNLISSNSMLCVYLGTEKSNIFIETFSLRLKNEFNFDVENIYLQLNSLNSNTNIDDIIKDYQIKITNLIQKNAKIATIKYYFNLLNQSLSKADMNKEEYLQIIINIIVYIDKNKLNDFDYFAQMYLNYSTKKTILSLEQNININILKNIYSFKINKNNVILEEYNNEYNILLYKLNKNKFSIKYKYLCLFNFDTNNNYVFFEILNLKEPNIIYTYKISITNKIDKYNIGDKIINYFKNDLSTLLL